MDTFIINIRAHIFWSPIFEIGYIWGGGWKLLFWDSQNATF